MGFKLRSGNTPDFKSMGSSPSPKAKAAPYNQGTQKMTDERWSDMSDKTKSTTGLSMNDLVRERDKAKKAGGNWQKYQNKINEAYGVKKRHEGAADKTSKGGRKTSTTVGSETVTSKTNKSGTKTTTKTENLQGKGVTKTKDGETTKDKFKEGKGGAAKNAAKNTGENKKGAHSNMVTRKIYNDQGEVIGTKQVDPNKESAERYRKSSEEKKASGERGAGLDRRIAKRYEKGKGDTKRTAKMEGRSFKHEAISQQEGDTYREKKRNMKKKNKEMEEKHGKA